MPDMAQRAPPHDYVLAARAVDLVRGDSALLGGGQGLLVPGRLPGLTGQEAGELAPRTACAKMMLACWRSFR
jgi:hypothetical protein